MRRLGVNFQEDVNPDHEHFYVSAIEGGMPYIVAGPYPHHQSALDAVGIASEVGESQTPRAAFMSWGTCSSMARIRAGTTPELLLEMYETLQTNPA